MAPSAKVALRIPPPEMHSALNGRDGSPPRRMAAASSCRTEGNCNGSSGMGTTLYPKLSTCQAGMAIELAARGKASMPAPPLEFAGSARQQDDVYRRVVKPA